MDTSRPGDGRPIDGPRELAADLGARWDEIEDDDTARALVNFAREHQVADTVKNESDLWCGCWPVVRDHVRLLPAG
jgi:K+-sensing histidine kinase KdpD